MQHIDMILAALNSLRVGPLPEENEIHSMIARTFDENGIAYIHEFPLAPGRRIDFACGSVGIEVKKGRPNAPALLRQLEKYLNNTCLEAMIVVMQKPCSLPHTICAKPVYVVGLNRLWGVALS